MFRHINQPIESSALQWVLFNPETSILEVQFKSGSWYSYGNVPAWRVRGLLNATSPGRYYNKYLQMNADPAPWAAEQKHPGNPKMQAVIKDSLKAITGHVPEKALPHIERFLFQIPVIIKVVKQRKTKHGDCKVLHKHDHAFITFDEGMTSYRALFTLLHELAHAEVSWRDVDDDQTPHAERWKFCFSRILFRAVEDNLFPNNIANLIYKHALNPSFATYVDATLEKALNEAQHNEDVRDISMGNERTSAIPVTGVWQLLTARLLGTEKTPQELASTGQKLSEEIKTLTSTAIQLLSENGTFNPDQETVKRLVNVKSGSDASIGLAFYVVLKCKDMLPLELRESFAKASTAAGLPPSDSFKQTSQIRPQMISLGQSSPVLAGEASAKNAAEQRVIGKPSPPALSQSSRPYLAPQYKPLNAEGRLKRDAEVKETASQSPNCSAFQ